MFWSKTSFCSKFRSLILGDERGSCKRKSLVVHVLAIKKLVLDINWFHSMRGVILKYFVMLDLVGKIILKLRKKENDLILYFWTNLGVF